MSCGLLDIPCHATNALASAVDWAFSLFSVNFIIGLVIGAALGAKFGWPAVIALAALFLTKFRRGTEQGSENIPDDSPDGRPSIFKPRRTAKRSPGKRRYDPDTNSWKEMP